MENRNNAQKTEIMNPFWIHDLIGNNGEDRLRLNF